MKVAPNTTLDGRGLLTLAPSFFGLDISARNVIVRNTIFRGPGVGREVDPAALHMVVPIRHSNCRTPTATNELFGCAVPIQLRGGAKNVWIDHNTFITCGAICLSVLATPEDGEPDMITVSYNVFRDSFFAANFGASAKFPSLPPPEHATLYGNFFDRVYRRQPGAGGSVLHLFNNYWRDYGGATYPGAPTQGCNRGFGPEVTAQAQMLLEENVAEAGPCGEAVDNQFFHAKDGPTWGYGKVRAEHNLGLHGGSLSGHDRLDFVPPYAYRPLPAADVKGQVLANAGAPGTR